MQKILRYTVLFACVGAAITACDQKKVPTGKPAVASNKDNDKKDGSGGGGSPARDFDTLDTDLTIKKGVRPAVDSMGFCLNETIDDFTKINYALGQKNRLPIHQSDAEVMNGDLNIVAICAEFEQKYGNQINCLTTDERLKPKELPLSARSEPKLEIGNSTNNSRLSSKNYRLTSKMVDKLCTKK